MDYRALVRPETQVFNMPFAIMRCAKIKTFGNAGAALQHCFRERETPNANPEQTPNNEHQEAQNVDEAMGKLRARLPEKRRKDAVLMVEYVFTASPEWFKEASQKDQSAFFDDAKRFLAQKYGEENIIVASIHRDEKTPHLSAFVVPITPDGKLSAKHFIGSKEKLSADQTKFATWVANLGLKRGIKGSLAEHQTIQQYYTKLKQTTEMRKIEGISEDEIKPQKLDKSIFSKTETPEQIAKRLNNRVREALQPFSALSLENDTLKKQNAALRAENDVLKQVNIRLQAFKDNFKKLLPDQLNGLLNYVREKMIPDAEKIRQEMKNAEEEKKRLKQSEKPKLKPRF